MYRTQKPKSTTISVNTSYEGERIEQKINRIVNNKEPITDGAPLIYTNRKDGVQPQYNIRSDRFDIAIEATDKIDKHHKAKREERHKPQGTTVEKEPNKDGKPESVQGTDNKK